MTDRPGRRIQTAALVHEVYLRLIDTNAVGWQHRAHFFAVCATMMRQVIELRFFVGLSVEETAEVLKVSADTVMRDWRLARSWLLTQLTNRM